MAAGKTKVKMQDNAKRQAESKSKSKEKPIQKASAKTTRQKIKINRQVQDTTRDLPCMHESSINVEVISKKESKTELDITGL